MSEYSEYKNSYHSEDNKGWSNISGYGQIVNNTYNNQSVSTNYSPWNLIQPLKKPVNSPANINYAWSPPLTSKMKKIIKNNCQ